MKRIIIGLIATSFTVFVSCNNGSEKKNAGQDSSGKNEMKHNETIDTTNVAEVNPTFGNIDSRISASIKTIVDNYLQIKDALTDDDGREASKGGDVMVKTLKQTDKSFFTDEQRKIYDDIGDDLQENADHIGENAGDIEHQREHFSRMSEDVYDLVKAFGGGRILYRDYCPMYNEGKGAIWLSEMVRIKNPYLGNKMPTCGNVVEKIK